MEPLLGWTDIARYCKFIRFCAAGGETGRNARPSSPDWFRKIRDQCVAAKVPFHFKAWGEWIDVDEEGGPYPTVLMERVGRRRAGRLLDGRTYDELPMEN